MKVIIKNFWNDSDKRKGKYLKKILLQDYVVHYRSHMNRPALHSERLTAIPPEPRMATH